MSESATACLTWPIPLGCDAADLPRQRDGYYDGVIQQLERAQSQPTTVRIT